MLKYPKITVCTGWNEDGVRNTQEPNPHRNPAHCHEEQDDKDLLLSEKAPGQEEQTPMPNNKTTSEHQIERDNC